MSRARRPRLRTTGAWAAHAGELRIARAGGWSLHRNAAEALQAPLRLRSAGRPRAQCDARAVSCYTRSPPGNQQIMNAAEALGADMYACTFCR